MTYRTRYAMAAVTGTMVAFVVAVSFSGVLSHHYRAPMEEPRSVPKTPNPSKAPLHFVGFQALLIGFDPFLAGTVVPNFLLIGPMALAWWTFAAMALAPRQGSQPPARRLRWILIVSAILGLALAWPWLYVAYREAVDPWARP